MMIEDFACQLISRNFYYLFSLSVYDFLFCHSYTATYHNGKMIRQKIEMIKNNSNALKCFVQFSYFSINRAIARVHSNLCCCQVVPIFYILRFRLYMQSKQLFMYNIFLGYSFSYTSLII